MEGQNSCDQGFISGPLRMQGDASVITACMFQHNLEMVTGKHCRSLIGPLDQCYGRRLRILFQTQSMLSLLFLKAVEVDVAHRNAPSIFVDQGKGRACDTLLRYAEANGDASDEAGFASSQLADERKHFPTFTGAPDALTEGMGRCR